MRDRREAIKQHLRFILKMRMNWDWWVRGSTGIFQGKVKIITGGKELILDKAGMDKHIERTKENLKRAYELR